ncbi:uncharacterized protein BDZ99DRAFT_498608 [Mytilinidion resinicola]|uniref:Uncharacterized protein n=1 Tax=Mytilinidion resinicola TaxID=574789 RepID=A0A6A6YPJ2_9PEZI|nr:uncharacterized protein BDZ99DRAFT_498608 [Mytilinidion resinicola]KAF2810479.1 hypothetical protein BDZ99DRAFT_498608 [Mytilinidion resinicola]
MPKLGHSMVVNLSTKITRVCRPPLTLACSVAWPFIAFSTSAGSSLAWAQFLVPAKPLLLDPWLVKYIASATVGGISFLAYRSPRYLIRANTLLGVFKAALLVLLVVTGLTAWITHSHTVPGLTNFNHHFHERVPFSNYALATILVFFCYSGFNSANYVTSEIKGGLNHHGDERSEVRQKHLRRGTLRAVVLVSFLYCCFNFLLPFNLAPGTLVTYLVSICIAVSSLGTVVSTVFTNSRAIREVAYRKLAPVYEMFQQSSEHGISRFDRTGTPTGAILLHALVTCVIISFVPTVDEFPEGIFFATSLSILGQSLSNSLLGFGIGIRFMKLRNLHIENRSSSGSQGFALDQHSPYGSPTEDPTNASRGGVPHEQTENQRSVQTSASIYEEAVSEQPTNVGVQIETTEYSDPGRRHSISNPPQASSNFIASHTEMSRTLNWSLHKAKKYLILIWKWIAVVVFTTTNIFIIVALCLPTDNPDGTPRRLNSPILLPAIVFSICGAGALYGLFILLVSFDFYYNTGQDEAVSEKEQGWHFKFPVFMKKASIRDQEIANSESETLLLQTQPESKLVWLRAVERREFPGVFNKDVWRVFCGRLKLKAGEQAV